jgi:acetylornithine deacetylase/succinyl-diaminopimelate desuccinylase-like protein
MKNKIDRQFLTDTLQQLVRINSVNPKLDSSAPREEKIGSFIAQILKAVNLEPEIRQLEPGRVNVTAVSKGSGGGRSLMINGHMDTVGVKNMKNPFSGNRRFRHHSYRVFGACATPPSAGQTCSPPGTQKAESSKPLQPDPNTEKKQISRA